MPGLTLQAALMWISSPILQLFCVYLLYRRKLLKQFAFFASYLLFLTVLNAIRFVCYQEFGLSSWTYYSVYWVGTALANMAALAVVYEIFCAAFKPFAGLQDLAKIVFKWAAGSIIFIVFVVFMSNAASPAGTPHHYLSASVHDFERIVGVMECALLIFLVLAVVTTASAADGLWHARGFPRRRRASGRRDPHQLQAMRARAAARALPRSIVRLCVV